MTGQSLAICSGCAAIAVGYSVYLAIWRSDLRLPPQGGNTPQLPSALRACPSCGIQIDAQAKKCPVCEADFPAADERREADS